MTKEQFGAIRVRYEADGCGYTDNDAEFIAHAREDIPALLFDHDLKVAGMKAIAEDRDKWKRYANMSRDDKGLTIEGMEIAIEDLKNDRDRWKARAEELAEWKALADRRKRNLSCWCGANAR